jgi:hypothetical protein
MVVTYVYQGAVSPTELRSPAPVSPEQGMNLRSLAGLKPHFFKYGHKLSLQ